MQQTTLYPIVYNKEYYVIVANDIVKGKQDMSLQEARILRLVITQVVKEDRDLKTYTSSIQEIAGFLGISTQNLYRDIRNICDNLAQRVVRIGTGNPKEPWKTFAWLQMASYDGAGRVTLMLSEQIKPFVLELGDYFTRYKLENILEMNSFYSIRLYELLKSEVFRYKEYQEYSIESLRQYFNCENKYLAFKDFRINVLEKSRDEINTKTDICIKKIEYKKNGRSFSSVKFYISKNRYTDIQRNPQIYNSVKSRKLKHGMGIKE